MSPKQLRRDAVIGAALAVLCLPSCQSALLEASAAVTESEIEPQNLFWNCDAANILSVSYIETTRLKDDSITPTEIKITIQHAKKTFDLKSQIKAIHYSQVRKPLVWQSESGSRQDLVNVHSFLLQLKMGVLRWNDTPTGTDSDPDAFAEAKVSSVSLNVIERPDGQFIGNHRLVFEKSKFFAPPEIRFNNQCQFFKVNEYLLGNKELMQKKFVAVP